MARPGMSVPFLGNHPPYNKDVCSSGATAEPSGVRREVHSAVSAYIGTRSAMREPRASIQPLRPVHTDSGRCRVRASDLVLVGHRGHTAKPLDVRLGFGAWTPLGHATITRRILMYAPLVR